jgi:hypothetical protein
VKSSGASFELLPKSAFSVRSLARLRDAASQTQGGSAGGQRSTIHFKERITLEQSIRRSNIKPKVTAGMVHRLLLGEVISGYSRD